MRRALTAPALPYSDGMNAAACSHLDQVTVLEPTGPIDGCEECLKTGDRWVHLRMLAGRSTARTIVASIRIATASPTPNCLKNSIERVAKIENTSTITIAALVTTPAVRLMPFEIASSMLSPRSYSSLIRPRTRTW